MSALNGATVAHPMALRRWSFRGHRIELEVLGPLFFVLEVDGQTRAKLPRGEASEVLLELDGERLRFAVRGDADFTLSLGTARVHPVTEFIDLVPVPPLATCAEHPVAPAAVVCGRCGRFACVGCASPDGVRCAECCEPADGAEASAQREERIWQLIVFVAAVLGVVLVLAMLR
mgnify:CR=1 FL=1